CTRRHSRVAGLSGQIEARSGEVARLVWITAVLARDAGAERGLRTDTDRHSIRAAEPLAKPPADLCVCPARVPEIDERRRDTKCDLGVTAGERWRTRSDAR